VSKVSLSGAEGTNHLLAFHFNFASTLSTEIRLHQFAIINERSNVEEVKQTVGYIVKDPLGDNMSSAV